MMSPRCSHWSEDFHNEKCHEHCGTLPPDPHIYWMIALHILIIIPFTDSLLHNIKVVK